MTRFAVILFLVIPATVQAQNIDRSGFTFALGIGIAHQQDFLSGPSSKAGEGLSLSLGAYLKNDMAIFVQLSKHKGTYLHDRVNPQEYIQFSEFIGTILQYWLNHRFYLEGGSGIGAVRHNGLSTLPTAHDIGFATLAGAGMVLHKSGLGLVKLGLENTFVVLDKKHVNNLGLILRYQLK